MDVKQAVFTTLWLNIVVGIKFAEGRRASEIKGFVDCLTFLGAVDGGGTRGVTSPPTDDAENLRDGNGEYDEDGFYYETSEDEKEPVDSGLEDRKCVCSQDFTEIICTGLTSFNGQSLFTPSALYGRLQDVKESLLNFGNESVFRLFLLSRESVRDMLPRYILQHMRFQRIVFNFNEIGKYLSQNLFSKETLESLETLEMGRCGLGSTLPKKLLKGASNLRRLLLWGNSIKMFPSNFFSDCIVLEELILWGNQIEAIDASTFGGVHQLHNLKLLDLDKNNIKDLPSGNNFYKENGFKQKAFSDAADFSYLANGIPSKDVVSSLSIIIGNRLETLKLGSNRIHTLPESFLIEFEELKLLKIDNNGLSYVYPGAFDGLKNLVHLSLASNLIGYLPDDIFAHMNNLIVLELQENRLEHLWFRTFRGLSSLQSLDLSKNRLSALAEGLFQHSPSLIRIDLSSNRLQTLDECSFHRPRHRLQSISLVNNPVICNCAISWFWRYMQSINAFEEEEEEGIKSTEQSLQTTHRVALFNQSLQFHPSTSKTARSRNRLRHHRREHRKRRRSDNPPLNYDELSQHNIDSENIFDSRSFSTSNDVRNDDIDVDASDAMNDFEVTSYADTMKFLIVWGSCSVSRDVQHHQQAAIHRGSKSSSTSKQSRQMPISSSHVRLLFNCSLDRCTDDF